TVNALYSAKYNEDTRDKFRPSNILIKIYQIKPVNQLFKQRVISATNNQNAVKTFSFFANDQIQIDIQENLNKLGYLYDRKGEARQNTSKKVVTMVQGALAFRAVFEYRGQELRAGMGQSRVFKKDEYNRIYKEEYTNNTDELNILSVKLLTASLILNEIKDLINEHYKTYLKELPIIKKSTYYLSGLYYALYMKECDLFINNIVKLLKEDNSIKIKHSTIIETFIKQIETNFEQLINKYQEFYDSKKLSGLDKTDIDNLLKSVEFGKQYNIFINDLLSNAKNKAEK
ncbi:MAG: AIPR family protein, partial [Nitrospirae bacterium]|nr:AIPR family protein [Nitrospirota bacterium]